MRRLLLLALIAVVGPGLAFADECDCFIFPFKPNPPCYRRCVGQLSIDGGRLVSNVKDIQPAVATAIQRLAQERQKGLADSGEHRP